MEYLTILDKIIDRGIEGAKKDYAGKTDKCDGAVAGFEACRNKTPHEILALLSIAQKESTAARNEHRQNYWYFRCYEAEVEWVLNCVSVLLYNQGQKPLIPPTARAYMNVASIVGVAAPD